MTPTTALRAAIYARVSTLEQNCDNQTLELRKYVEARGWTAQEYVDRGVSGSKDKRPALDALLKDAKRRRFDVLVCWRLDRLGRNLRHLITLLDDLQALGVAFVSLAEGIDATTPAGKLQMHIVGAIAEFERELIRERVRSGIQAARARGKRLGRPRTAVDASRVAVLRAQGLSWASISREVRSQQGSSATGFLQPAQKPLCGCPCNRLILQ